jgi:hypothetical protein
MKKAIFVFAASLFLMSCGAPSEVETTDSTEIVQDTTLVVDSTVVETPADSVLGTGTGGDIPAVK